MPIISYRTFLFLPLRCLTLKYLSVNVRSHGTKMFRHNPQLSHDRTKKFLKDILQSAAFAFTFSFRDDLFITPNLPTFDILFKETVVISTCCDSPFQIPDKISRLLRHVPPFKIPRILAHCCEQKRTYLVSCIVLYFSKP